MRAANFSSQFGKFFTVERTLILIFIVALLLRFLFLDLKLLHHDESIHSWFALRLLEYGIYSYDPVYHGPLLYYATAGVFSLLGASDLSARILPSFLGTVLVLLVYPIYRLGYLDRKQTIFAGLFLAISPDMVYFSRFLRNDIFVVFFTLVILVALLYYIERKELKYAALGAAAAGLAMSCKENVPIILLIFGVYLLYLVYSGRFTLPVKWVRDLIISLVIIIGIMAAFYSSFGMHPEILINGPFDALNHWISMHEEQRLGGPFYFYIILLLLYELPILILAAAGVIGFLRYREKKANTEIISPKEPKPAQEAPALSLLPSAGNEDKNIPPEETDSKASLEEETYGSSGEMHTEPSFIAEREIEPAVPKSVLNKNREFTRFCIFWMVASLAVYAYLGEKVPWLILHQLVPMIFVAVYDFSKWKVWLSAAGVVFLLVMTMHVAFTPDDIAEPIVQVQNSEDLREVMKYIDSADRVAISDEVRWPFVWYSMQDSPQKVFYYSKGYDSSAGPEDYDVIILHDAENIDSIPGFTKYTYKKCYWLDVYNLVQSTRYAADLSDENYRNAVAGDIKRIISYYFTRNSGLGSINLDVFVKKQAA